MENNKLLRKIQSHTALKFLVAFVVSALLYMASSFVFPILLSIGLSFCLYPLTRSFTKLKLGRTGLHPSSLAAIILAFVALAIFAAFILTGLVLPLFGQINELIQRMPEYTDKMQSDPLVGILSDPSKLMLPSSVEGLLEEAIGWVMNFVATVVRNLLKSTVQIVANLFGLIVVPFLSFYFLKDWKRLREMVADLFTPDERPKVLRVINNIGLAVSSYVEGLWKMSLISAIFVTLMLFSMKVPYPLVFGFIALLAETVPVIGPLIAAVPAIFVAHTSVSPTTGFTVAVLFLIYYTIDSQFLMPYLMGRKINLHPVVIILALMITGKLFGIVGMLFAMPIAAVYRVLYDELWHYGEEEAAEDALHEGGAQTVSQISGNASLPKTDNSDKI